MFKNQNQSQFNILYKALNESPVSLFDLVIPEKLATISKSGNVMGQILKISHKKLNSFNYTIRHYFHNNIWTVTYSPAQVKVLENINMESWNKIFDQGNANSIYSWFKYVRRELVALEEKESFFYKLRNSNTTESSFINDEPFSEYDIKETLPRAFEDLKQRILESEIPDENKKVLIAGVAGYFEKIKSGKMSKRDLVGGVLYFFYSVLAIWELNQFFGFLSDSFKEAFKLYYSLHP